MATDFRNSCEPLRPEHPVPPYLPILFGILHDMGVVDFDEAGRADRDR